MYLHSTNIQSLWKESFCEQGKNGNDHLDPLMELYRGLPKNTPKTYIHCRGIYQDNQLILNGFYMTDNG